MTGLLSGSLIITNLLTVIIIFSIFKSSNVSEVNAASVGLKHTVHTHNLTHNVLESNFHFNFTFFFPLTLSRTLQMCLDTLDK